MKNQTQKITILSFLSFLFLALGAWPSGDARAGGTCRPGGCFGPSKRELRHWATIQRETAAYLAESGTVPPRAKRAYGATCEMSQAQAPSALPPSAQANVNCVDRVGAYDYRIIVRMDPAWKEYCKVEVEGYISDPANVRSCQVHGGGNNDTYLLTYENGTQGIYKTDFATSTLLSIQDQSLEKKFKQSSEVKVYKMAKVLGVSDVAPIVRMDARRRGGPLGCEDATGELTHAWIGDGHISLKVPAGREISVHDNEDQFNQFANPKLWFHFLMGDCDHGSKNILNNGFLFDYDFAFLPNIYPIENFWHDKYVGYCLHHLSLTENLDELAKIYDERMALRRRMFAKEARAWNALSDEQKAGKIGPTLVHEEFTTSNPGIQPLVGEPTKAMLGRIRDKMRERLCVHTPKDVLPRLQEQKHLSRLLQGQALPSHFTYQGSPQEEFEGRRAYLMDLLKSCPQ